MEEYIFSHRHNYAFEYMLMLDSLIRYDFPDARELAKKFFPKVECDCPQIRFEVEVFEDETLGNWTLSITSKHDGTFCWMYVDGYFRVPKFFIHRWGGTFTSFRRRQKFIGAEILVSKLTSKKARFHFWTNKPLY